jgi:pimeloyl-ACP methyl ester carboxylesterase
MPRMRRLVLGFLLFVTAAVSLPVLWFALFPEPEPALPAQGITSTLTLGGNVVNVVRAGEGPPVVLVHGLPGSAYDWRVLSAALSARGRLVLAYDRAGYGYSQPAVTGAYTLERNAEDLVKLLELFQLRDATVVGWSYGGAVAIRAAQKDHSRMARLVLIASVGPGAKEIAPPAVTSLFLSDPVLAWLRLVPPVARGVIASESEQAFSGQSQPSWWQSDVAANFARPTTALAYRAELASFAAEKPPLPVDLGVPVVVIHGDQDRMVPIGIGRQLAASAGVPLIEIAGGSHMLPVTHAERLADAIAPRSPSP